MTFGLIQRQPDLCQPRLQELLGVLKDLAVFMQHHTIVGISNDTSVRVDPGDGVVHPMQGNQGQQRGDTSPLWRPCGSGIELVLFQDTRFQPSFELPTNDG